jgi:biotin carboxyl carrier protein
MRYLAKVKGRTFAVEITGEDEVSLDGQAHRADLQSIGGLPLYSLLLDNRSYEMYVDRDGETYRVLLAGELYPVDIRDERSRGLASQAPSRAAARRVAIEAPMPGLVVAVKVAPGDEVLEGQSLVTLEAMKMENELRAPQEGTVESVRVGVGEVVQQRQILITLRPS